MPLNNTGIENILREVKNEVGYNPDEKDSDTDSRLTRYIKQGVAKIEHIAGSSINFSTDMIARGLLVDYCRYANSQCSELFEKNFQEALASLHADYQVKNHIFGGDYNE